MKPAAPAAAEPLLEREAELERLLAGVARLRGTAPRGACMLVHGESGVGKTSLMRRLRDCAGEDVHWLCGHCEPTLWPPPLAPLLELLDALPIALAAAVRGGRTNAEVLAGMLGLLRDRARPLVLLIDDAQWADSATLDLLSYIGRRIESTRALLVLTYRDDELEGDHPLRTLLGHLPRDSTERLRLAPLSRAAVAELARRVGRSGEGVHRLTQGNPFFVAELLAAGDTELPGAVRDAVLARAGRLSLAARDVLDLASMAPDGLEADVLDAVLGASDDAIDECLRCALLQRDAAAVLRFRHELARGSIAGHCGPQRSATLHGALFDALSLRGAAAARLVHHAECAGLGAAVLRLAPLAADEAGAASAHRQAADLMALAVRESARLTDVERAPLVVAHAKACMACHRFDDARLARRRALALHVAIGDPLAQGRDLRELARIEWFLGKIDSGVEHAARAIDILERIGAERELAMACATMAQLHIMDESPAEAVAWGRRALVTFEALDDAEGLAYALNTVGFGELLAGGGSEAWARVERSLSIAREHDMEEPVGRAYANLASLAVLHRRFDALRRWCDEGIVHCEARDQDMFVARLRVRLAYGWMEQGEWQQALDELACLDALPAVTPLEAEQARHVRALVDLRRGEPAHAYWSEMLDGRRRLTVDPWYMPQSVARAEAAWLRGDAPAVERIATQALQGALRSGERWRTGQLACWLARVGALPAGFEATVCEPCAAELAGDHRGAAQAWDQLGCRYDAALSLLHGDESAQREAIAQLDGLGALPAARAARRRLREQGADDVGRGPNRHARSDPLGLTARERQVLDLLGRHRSTRDIAALLHRSERTIEHHVAALLDKLGVSSRAEAVEADRRHRGEK